MEIKLWLYRYEYGAPPKTAERLLFGWNNGRTRIDLDYSHYGFLDTGTGLCVRHPELEQNESERLNRLFHKEPSLLESMLKREGVTFVHAIPEGEPSPQIGGSYNVLPDAKRQMIEAKIRTAYDACAKAYRFSHDVNQQLDALGLVKILSDEDIAVFPMLVEKDKLGMRTPEGTVAVFMPSNVEERRWDRLIVCKPEYAERLTALYAAAEKAHGVTVSVEMMQRAA